MVIALGVIAALLLASVVYLKKFMKDMAAVEKQIEIIRYGGFAKVVFE